MAIELSTAGISLNYCVETTAGTRPASSYTKIAGIKSIPDLNPEPSTLETTTLDSTEWKTYIFGLKDVGGALAFGANNTEAFQTEWGALVTAAETAETSSKSTWFAVVVPGLTKSFYFSGKPSPLGLSAAEVDSVLEIDAYISPSAVAGWQSKPTSTL